MKLKDLVSAIFQDVDDSVAHWKLSVLNNEAQLHALQTDLPGKPTGLQAGPQRRLEPKRMTLQWPVKAVEKDGELHVELSSWRRRRSTLFIEWEAADTSEIVARLVNHSDDKTTLEIKRDE